MKTAYNKKFYEIQKDDSYNAAKIIIPYILEQFKPKSIIDIGCGVGTWLKAWSENGVKDYLGVDGAYIPEKELLIPHEHFQAIDLKEDFFIGKRYDLLECIEVIEHLPAELAEVFIKRITQISDVILFSAALPYQGGTNHINENWLEYWAALFKNHDYVPIDFIRKKIWTNALIPFWYRQNIIVFVKSENESHFTNDPIFKDSLSVIHPEMLLWTSSKLSGNEKKINSDIEYFRSLSYVLTEKMSGLPKKIINYKNLIPNKNQGLLFKITNKILRLIKKAS
jgi:hypothetical protein